MFLPAVSPVRRHALLCTACLIPRNSNVTVPSWPGCRTFPLAVTNCSLALLTMAWLRARTAQEAPRHAEMLVVLLCVSALSPVLSVPAGKFPADLCHNFLRDSVFAPFRSLATALEVFCCYLSK